MKKLIEYPDSIHKKFKKVKEETGQPIMAQIREILIKHFKK